ncbi:hypothetical protein [Staphylococcus saprophyticus]|uniref:hypothetical protein n=1 Tax=Staphylococcus saprophyticus TaxID=29385 RepID=UPI000E6A0931|nr:hypothetical protein [Staphylococcus saprophyticus]RIO42041.1 hypothetical protein BUZ70_08490 [Staphylococcus saprophyticus]
MSVEEYIVDIGAKGVLSTIIAGVMLNVILRGYDKLKHDRDSDVFEDSITLFITTLLIYSVIAFINIPLLYLIYDYYKDDNGIMNITAIAILIVVIMTIAIPITYFRTLTLLKNKYYLVKRENENLYELLVKGFDIINSPGYEVNNEIPLLSKINIRELNDYRDLFKKYYDKEIKGYFHEIVYVHRAPIKRFIKIIPNLWIVLILSIPVVYALIMTALILFGNELILIWIYIIGLILLYIFNFLVFVRISDYITRQNKMDQYSGYYKTNNLA